MRHQETGQQSAGGGGVDVEFAGRSRRIFPGGKSNSFGESLRAIEREPKPLWLCRNGPLVSLSSWVQQRFHPVNLWPCPVPSNPHWVQ